MIEGQKSPNLGLNLLRKEYKDMTFSTVIRTTEINWDFAVLNLWKPGWMQLRGRFQKYYNYTANKRYKGFH